MKTQNSKLKTQNSRKGFTLIEMLVVIVVFGIGIVGAFAFFNINMANQFEAKNELIAAALAQEGVDLVRNIRDYNLLNSLNWYNNLHDNTSSQCSAIDYGSLSSHACTAAGSSVCIDATSKRYYQCGSSDTNSTGYIRTITISRSGDLSVPGNSLQVKCDVTWNGRTTTAIDYLYDTNL